MPCLHSDTLWGLCLKFSFRHSPFFMGTGPQRPSAPVCEEGPGAVFYPDCRKLNPLFGDRSDNGTGYGDKNKTTIYFILSGATPVFCLFRQWITARQSVIRFRPSSFRRGFEGRSETPRSVSGQSGWYVEVYNRDGNLSFDRQLSDGHGIEPGSRFFVAASCIYNFPFPKSLTRRRLGPFLSQRGG